MARWLITSCVKVYTRPNKVNTQNRKPGGNSISRLRIIQWPLLVMSSLSSVWCDLWSLQIVHRNRSKHLEVTLGVFLVMRIRHQGHSLGRCFVESGHYVHRDLTMTFSYRSYILPRPGVNLGFLISQLVQNFDPHATCLCNFQLKPLPFGGVVNVLTLI